MAEISQDELLARRRKVVIGAIAAVVLIFLLILLGRLGRGAEGDGADVTDESKYMTTNFTSPEEMDRTKASGYEAASASIQPSASVGDATNMWKALSGGDGQAPVTADNTQRDINAMNEAIEQRRREAQAPPQVQPSAETPPASSAPKASSPRRTPAPKKEDPVEEAPVVESAPKRLAVDEGWGDGGVSSLDDSWSTSATHSGPAKCTFLESRTVKPGERVTLRLLDPLEVDGVRLPENTQLSAQASVTGGRLALVVTGFKLNGVIHSVSLVAYDSDGSRGLYCPEGMSEVRNTARRRAVSLGTGTVAGAVANIAGQVIQTGVDAVEQARQAASVNVLAGYTFYLVNETK